MKRERTWVMLMLTAVAGYGWEPTELELVWSDEFDYVGAPDPARWGYDLGAGGWGNVELQTYTNAAENVRVENGHLVIEVQQNLSTRVPSYTSARVVTRDTGSWKYGRIEVRARMPLATGLWPAIWMLSTDSIRDEVFWPNNGEIDIMEMVGYESDPAFVGGNGPYPPIIHATIHTELRHAGNAITQSLPVADAAEAFRTYALDWKPDRLIFYVDDLVVHEIVRANIIPQRNPPEDLSPWWPFDQRFHLLLNIAVGGTWGGHFNSNNYPNSPYDATGVNHNATWPQRMEVDYVRVYSYQADHYARAVNTWFEADAFYRESGVKLAITDDPEGQYHLRDVSAGDTVDYVIEATTTGDYDIAARLRKGAAQASLSITNLTNNAILQAEVLPGSAKDTWGTQTLGTVRLESGLNIIRVSFGTAGTNLSRMQAVLTAPGNWKGWILDTDNNISTPSMGLLNVEHEPWVWSHRLQGWMLPMSVYEDTFRTGQQWVYFPKF